MSTNETTRTVYGIARDQKLLSGGYHNVGTAMNQLALYEEQMTHLGIEPDVRLIEYDVTVTTKQSRLRAFKWPDEEQAATEVEDAPTGDAS